MSKMQTKMDIGGLLHAKKNAGFGKTNGEACSFFMAAWDFLLNDQQKKEAALFFNLSHPCTRDQMANACLEYLARGCHQGKWSWMPSD